MTRPPHAELTHIGFYVSDIEPMVAFYTTRMGMVVTDRGEAAGRAWAFLSRNPEEHHQIVIATGRPPESFQQINQISFRVADLETLRRWYVLMEEAAPAGLEAVTHGNAWSLYFHDPEGNRIELYASSPWYVNQPMRIPVDLHESVEALTAQTDALTQQDPSRRPHAVWSEELRTLIDQPQEADVR